MSLSKYFNQRLFYLLKNRTEGYPQFRIALTYRCNNTCVYCPSSKINGLLNKDMYLDDFKRILIWLKKQNFRKIILTGGEPFIHKDIKEVLRLCYKLRFSTYIFTNGLLINSEFKEYIKRNNLFLIFNINLDESYYAVRKNMSGSREKIIMLRYNLYKKLENYSLLFNMAREFSVPIRFGFTVPSIILNNECYSFQDMVDRKDEILSFVNEAGLNRVKVHLARPLPRCIFTNSEWHYLIKFAAVKDHCLIGDSGNYAARAIVNPDLSVDVCYSSIFKADSIFDFNDLKGLSRYFKDKIDYMRNKPLIDKCNTCQYYKDHSCQGGCLVYKYVSR
ncbi:MAG: radical SAM protein [Candidatus Omnitrophota bacterium]